MTAIEQAAKIYAEHGMNLSTDLENYIKSGYVFVTPDRMLLARPMIRSAGMAHWPADTSKADCWFVRLAVGQGGLKFFYQQMPFFLPFVSWQRTFKGDNRALHIYRTERLTKILYG